MTTDRPRKVAQALTIQHVGSETLLYDDTRHQAFCLNSTSAAVWNLADGTRTPDELAAEASRVLAAPVSPELIGFTLAELRRDGLLQLAPVAILPVPPVSRRAMIASLGASSLVLLPAVAVIMAPKAAQAYGGCFDCSNTAPAPNAVAAQRRAQAQDAARQAQAQKSKLRYTLRQP